MKQTHYLYSITLTLLWVNVTATTDTALAHKIFAPISYGELVDKITILELKSERITDEEKLKNIHTELALLTENYNELIGNRQDIIELKKELKLCNEIIWDCEDLLRAQERTKTFDPIFTYLARCVYYTNDKRCATKRRIDALLGSYILEEKSHKPYA